MGYTAENEQDYWSWNKKDNKQYALLLIVIAIIFFTTAILFNSLKQPLAIIFVIPISYIGVFLTFYLFGLNFDQGICFFCITLRYYSKCQYLYSK